MNIQELQKQTKKLQRDVFKPLVEYIRISVPYTCSESKQSNNLLKESYIYRQTSFKFLFDEIL